MAFKNNHIPWNKGKTGVYSEETLRKIGKSSKLRTPWNKGKIGIIKNSEETRRKMSESHKGKKHSIEERIKISTSHNGHIVTEKTREILSRKNKGKRNSPDTEFKKGYISFLGKKHTSETRQKISKAHKGIHAGNKNPAWKGGLSYLPYCHKFNKSLKEQIRDRDNRTCQLCGVKENGKKLCVHHIHYDKPNCEPDLISVCLSCHRKTSFNRDYYENLFMKNLEERGLICV